MSQESWEIYSGTVAAGETTTPNTKDALRAAMNNHAGTSRPGYLEAGGFWYHNVDLIIYFYDGTNDIFVMKVGVRALPDNVTPDVTGGGDFEEAFGSAKTVTSFTGGVKGNHVMLLITTSNMTLGPLLSKTGKTIPLVNGDRLEFVHNGTKFVQIAGNVGMGLPVKIDPVNISGWIGGNIIVSTEVSLLSYIRQGADSITLQINKYKLSGTTPNLSIGQGEFDVDILAPLGLTGQNINQPMISGVSDAGSIWARYSSSWSPTVNDCSVLRYTI